MKRRIRELLGRINLVPSGRARPPRTRAPDSLVVALHLCLNDWRRSSRWVGRLALLVNVVKYTAGVSGLCLSRWFRTG